MLSAACPHCRIVVVVASGDYGFGPADYPADLANVTAVGGTMLSRASYGRGWAERVRKANAAPVLVGVHALTGNVGDS